ncbi:hypothetical protein M405DRAFT_819864 [Rhizopogon salebrosus TDB-379]|nr:hypothetical protein M405DRAFT_819864 [Rhizopogon salebrosus TDB-379]
MHNWPVSSEAARHDLETIVETHRVVPTPAYDVNSNLIHLQNYRKMLRGALAQVDFAFLRRRGTRQGIECCLRVVALD